MFCLRGAERQRLRDRAEQERQHAADQLEFPNRRRTLLVAVATVVTVMASYALVTGLWKVEVVDEVVDHVVRVGRTTRSRHRTHSQSGTLVTDCDFSSSTL